VVVGKNRSHGGGFGAMKKIALAIILCCAAASGVVAAPKDKKKEQVKAAFGARQVHRAGFPAGNHHWPHGCHRVAVDSHRLVLGSGGDQRSRRVDDIVTIVVQESASAVSSGQVKTSASPVRKAASRRWLDSLKATGPWANLANLVVRRR